MKRWNQEIDLVLVFLLCALAYAFAKVSESVWSLTPCILCKAQQILFAGGFLGGGLLLINTKKPPFPAYRWFLILVFVLMLGLSLYQTLLELGLVREYEFCKITLIKKGPDQLKQVLNSLAPSCKTVQWRLFGLSMANWNVFLSGGVLLLLSRIVTLPKKRIF